MRRSLALVDWWCLALAPTSCAVSFLFYGLGSRRTDEFELAFCGVILGAAAVCGVIEALTSDKTRYLLMLALRTGSTMIALLLTTGIAGAEIPLLAGLLIPVSLHNPYPWNLRLTSFVTAASLVSRVAVHLFRGAKTTGVIAFAVDTTLAAAAVGISISLMIRYREQLIEQQNDNHNLHDVVDRLTRINLRYQEHVRTVEEASTRDERKRIIRDIHDVVGSTLTNTITMMEAVTDMMRVNPLGVASLVRATRANAEEGLHRIRSALYLLRDKEIHYPTGWYGVQRLIGVFQKATGVQVELVRSDPSLGWQQSGPIEEAIYHVVEGSLLNAFRHGKATNVRIFVGQDAGDLLLSVRDNGLSLSSDVLSEGIGLTGMRERVQELGGVLHAGPGPGGFEVSVMIPFASERSAHA